MNIAAALQQAHWSATAEGFGVLQATEETEQMRFNTGISALMEFVNAAYKWDAVPKSALRPFVLLLAPYAPHLAEELWQVRDPEDA